MSALTLARLQFGTTAGIHFMFVALTLGLAPLVAIMETRYLATRNPVHDRMARFWGLIYVTNYAVGIFSGLIMEFQFGLDWSGLTHFMGNIFGGPLALETLMAFFAESTFLGMWMFGWNHLPKTVHVSLIWLVTATAYLSAFWILSDNAFMHYPVGYTLKDGVVHLTDFVALLTSSNLWLAFFHILSAAMISGGVMLAGVGGWHLWRRTEDAEVFRRSVRIGVVTTAVGLLPSIFFGIEQFVFISQHQPGFGRDGQLLAGSGQEFMIYSWALLVVLVVPALFMIGRRGLSRRQPWLRLFTFAIPVPLLATVAGWIYREVGRQPWVMYGMFTTRHALGPVSSVQVAISYVAFTTLLLALAATDYLLISRTVRQGPRATAFGADAQSDGTGAPSLLEAGDR